MKKKGYFLIFLFLWFILAADYVSCGGQTISSKQVVFIIAQNGFRDEEFFQPKEILEKAGIKVKVASESLSLAKGMLGAIVKPDILLTDIDVKEFDAIVFIGGIGASQYWNNYLAHKIIRDAVSQNKIIGAICIAPVTLANAGILESRRATVWGSEADKLKAAGAVYTARPVERDGNIITASGPAVAAQFGNELLKALMMD